jgi:beta-xylosidase
VPETSDEFASGELRPCWQWHANHSEEWFSLRARPGYLRLNPVCLPGLELLKAPNLLLQKLPARSFRLETEIEVSQDSEGLRAGLVVMGDSHAALVVEQRAGVRAVALLIDGRSLFSANLPNGPVRLRVALADGGSCRFEYTAHAQATVRLEPTFQAQRGRWIGTKVGLFALCEGSAAAAGHADFSYFRFSPG